MKIYILLAALLILVQLQLESTDNQLCNFDNYIVQFQKKYKDENEQKKRQMIFNKNCQIILAHNNDPNKFYNMTINMYTDRLIQQLSDKMNLPSLTKQSNLQKELVNDPKIENSINSSSQQEVKLSADAIPERYDYNFFGNPSSLVDVGTCNAHWAHSATRYYYYMIRIKKNNMNIVPSVQSTLECTSLFSPQRRANDCFNGNIVDSLTHLAKVGAVAADVYPYMAYDYGKKLGHPRTMSICTQQDRIVLGNGTAAFEYNLTNDQIKMKIVNEGPLVVGLKLHPNMLAYQSGNFNQCTPNVLFSEIDHFMTLIGYEGGSWILQTNWGAKFGQFGKIYIVEENDCGIGHFVGNIIFSTINSQIKVTLDPSQFFEPQPESSTNHQNMALILICLSILSILLN